MGDFPPRKHRAQLRQAVRVTVAALLSFAIARFFNLPLPLWAVLTAIIVTQANVGRSLVATVDYLSGTLGGAAYGAAVAVLVPYSSESGLLLVLTLAVAPLAVVAAFKPALTVAPVTAVIVILLPTMTHASPVASAFDRGLEVALGGVVGFAVSFLVLPANAHRMVAEAAAGTLGGIAQAFGRLLDGLAQGLDMEALHRIQDHIGQELGRLDAICIEAERERSVFLAAGPDPAPLVRTLLRLRHDLVMIGRVAQVPSPVALRQSVRPCLDAVRRAFSANLDGCGAALLARGDPPPLDGVDAALAAYLETDAAVERPAMLDFALEQMRRDLGDLGERVAEWRRPSVTSRRAARSSTRSAA